MKRHRIAPGIYQDAHGIGVVARIGSGATERKSQEVRFPLGTPTPVMEACWHRLKKDLLESRARDGDSPVRRGTFADDVRLYFKTAQLSPKRVEERTQQLAWWVSGPAKFGSRLRASLLPGEIRRALNTLDLAASSRNKYRMALSHLFTILDGKNAPNPCRDVPQDKEPDAERRDQPYELIDLILSILGDASRPGEGLSKGKARLRVLAYAPITSAQLSRITEADVDLERAELWVHGRKKGKGTKGKQKPLMPEGVAAFRAYAAAGCWGAPPPSGSSLLKMFVGARDKAIAILRETRPDVDLSRADQMLVKDLRHSFGTMVYRTTGSLSATSALLDHADAKTTLRYAQGAIPDLLKAAGDQIAAAMAARPKVSLPPAPPRLRLVKHPQG